MKKALKIILIILACIIFLVGALALTNYISSNANTKYAQNVEAVQYESGSQLVPYMDEETGCWTFKCDRDFRIMQLTDIHIGSGFLSIQKDNWTLSAVETLVKDQKPDLVIVTGDIGFPLAYKSGSFNNLTPFKEFTTLMESLQVYWTLTFGNHDSEVFNYYDREYISNYILDNIKSGNFKYCLYTSSFEGQIDGYEGLEADAGYGNAIINIKNSADAITQSLFIMDSHAYEKGFYRDYDHMHQCQIDWYKANLIRLNELNKKKLGVIDDTMTIKSLAFFHIPPSECKTAYTEWRKNGEKDTENVKYLYGKMGEDADGDWVYCGVSEDTFFETMMEMNSTQGVFFGHDHYNNFSLLYNGGSGDHYIRLTYGMSIDYLAYFGIAKETAQRGCTMITVTPEGAFDCYGYRLSDKTKIN